MAKTETTTQTTTDEMLKAMMPETPAPKLVRVYRADGRTLDSTYYTEEGYLIDDPVVTTCGIFEYVNSDGSIRRELRTPEEVFDEESLKSYVGKPIIITHNAGAIDKDNVEDEIIGTILSDGTKDGDSVRVKIVIHDTDAMKECGLRELSLGYSLDLDETPGEWHGQPYDAVQRNIRINHLALVQTARAGDTARLNIDGSDKENTITGGSEMDEEKEEVIEEIIKTVTEDAETETETETTETAPAEETTETEKTIEEIVEEIKEHLDCGTGERKDEDVIAQQHDDIETLLDIVEKLEAAKDFAEATAETDGEETENEDCDTHDDGDEGKSENLNLDSADVERIIADKLDVIYTGEKLGIEGMRDMTISDGRKAVVKKVLPRMNLDGKSDTYIAALYDCAKVTSAERKPSKATDAQRAQAFNKDAAEKNTKDMGRTNADIARENMIARQLRSNAEEKND